MISNNSSGDIVYTGTANLEVMREAVNYNSFLCGLVRSVQPKLTENDIVVDFGAGIGTFSDILGIPRSQIICVESDPEQRNVLSGQGFQTASLDSIANNSVRFAYSLNVFEHIPDDDFVLLGLATKLCPGGRLLIYVPAFNLLWSPMDEMVGHIRRYRRKDLKEMLHKAGLKIQKLEYADSAGFFATLLFKIVGRDSKGTISLRALTVFDRIFFPIGRMLDVCGFRWLLGKNVWVCAEKS